MITLLALVIFIIMVVITIVTLTLGFGIFLLPVADVLIFGLIIWLIVRKKKK